MSNLWSTLTNTPKLVKTTINSVLISTPYIKVIKAIYYGFFDLFNYYFKNSITAITPIKSDSHFYTKYTRLKIKQSYYNLFTYNQFFYIDTIIYFFKSTKYVLFDFM